MSRIALVAVSIVVGAVLAAAAVFAVTELAGSAQSRPANQQIYNYGSP